MSVLFALLGLSLVIIVHELGHFGGAVLGGMRVKQFALGFGRRVLGFRRGETEYRLNILPFGAYVMVDGALDEETEGAADPRQMFNRPWWARALFIMAGPVLNIVLAALLVLAAAGLQGLPAGRAVVIGEVEPGSPAAAAGILPNDAVASLNGRRADTIESFQRLLAESGGSALLRVRRSGRDLTLAVSPRAGRIGVLLYERVIYSRRGMTISAAAVHTGRELAAMAASVYSALVSLFAGRAGMRDLSGPVGMVKSVAASAAFGPASFLLMLALISVNLGLFNLLPIPALDGGRLLFLAAEKILGRKPNLNWQAGLTLAGFAAILILIVMVSIQDVLRIMGGR